MQSSTDKLAGGADGLGHEGALPLIRGFAWASVNLTFVYLVNVYLTLWMGWPGAVGLAGGAEGGAQALAALQALSYLAVIAVSFYLARSSSRSLREDSARMTAISAFIVRAAFWAVVLVGLADMVISFMRVEGLLAAVVGEDLTSNLGRSNFRGAWVHMPLIGVGILLAMVTRTLGFTWLALLVVVAELQIVISRFVFSYEQAFMGDLVRFWYAALFLFASAYTLLEEGHVRVDVFYAGFTSKTKGYVNALGSVILGMSLCWIILGLGMWDRANIIVSPILSFEVTQSGFGMYVKYLMAGFLAIFAVSMNIQFAAYLLDAVADIRGDPGGRDHDSHATA